MPRLQLEAHHIDIIGLALIAIGIFLSGVAYLRWSGGALGDGMVTGLRFLFGALGLIPSGRHAKVVEASITLNYTTVLNIVFLVLAAAMVYRFVRTGGIPMLREMGGGPDRQPNHADHAHHGAAG